MTKILPALLCAVFLASTASAAGGGGGNGSGGSSESSGGTKLSQAASDPLGSGVLPVVGMHDMEGHRWGVAASPFIWQTTHINTDGGCCASAGGAASKTSDLPSLHGFGGSLAVQYEFTPHWGAEVFWGTAYGGTEDIGNQISGLAPQTAFNGTPNGAGFQGGQFHNFQGTVIGAMGVWDPFNHPNGFRMPISLGFFEGWQSFDFDHTFTNPNNAAVSQTESVRFRRSYPGVVTAISFDFLVFKNFRIAPGALVGQGFAGQEAGYDYVVQQNGGASRSFHGTLTGTPGFGTVYIAASYRPWGIGYTLTLIPSVASTQAISWSHRWGAAKEAK